MNNTKLEINLRIRMCDVIKDIQKEYLQGHLTYKATEETLATLACEIDSRLEALSRESSFGTNPKVFPRLSFEEPR
jgi:hypothetical protein